MLYRVSYLIIIDKAIVQWRHVLDTQCYRFPNKTNAELFCRLNTVLGNFTVHPSTLIITQFRQDPAFWLQKGVYKKACSVTNFLSSKFVQRVSLCCLEFLNSLRNHRLHYGCLVTLSRDSRVKSLTATRKNTHTDCGMKHQPGWSHLQRMTFPKVFFCFFHAAYDWNNNSNYEKHRSTGWISRLFIGFSFVRELK